MRRDIVTSAIAIVVLTVILGVLYPLAVTGISQGVFPGNADGQKIYVNGKLVGSKIIGQSFGDEVVKNGKVQLDKNKNPITNPDPRYFQTRPSATTLADDASSSTFSNLGPNSTITRDAIVANIQAYIALEGPYAPGLTAAKVPVDAADTSASGIDPDISVANARIQSHRVAAVRHLTPSQVNGLVHKYTHDRGLGFSGEPGVNVLQLNLALDRITGGH